MEGFFLKRKFNLFSVTNCISHSNHSSIYISNSFTWRSSVANFINLARVSNSAGTLKLNYWISVFRIVNILHFQLVKVGIK